MIGRVCRYDIAQATTIAIGFVIIDGVACQGDTIGMNNLRTVEQLRSFGLGVVPAFGGENGGLFLIEDLGGTDQVRAIALGIITQCVGGEYKLRVDQFHIATEDSLMVIGGILSPR